MSEELARRAIACKGFRWTPGMLTSDGARLLFEDRNLGWQAWSLDKRRHTLPPDPLPNLTDPATVGCLLALVREAYGKPGTHALRIGASSWRVYDDAWLKRAPLGKGDTEAEALVAALEAAP